MGLNWFGDCEDERQSRQTADSFWDNFWVFLPVLVAVMGAIWWFVSRKP